MLPVAGQDWLRRQLSFAFVSQVNGRDRFMAPGSEKLQIFGWLFLADITDLDTVFPYVNIRTNIEQYIVGYPKSSAEFSEQWAKVNIW